MPLASARPVAHVSRAPYASPAVAGRRRSGGRLSLVLPAAALAIRLASETSADLSYLVLAVHALRGRAEAIQALALSWLFSMLSPGVAPLVPGATVGRYAVMLAAALSVVARSGLPRSLTPSRSVLATLALGAFLVAHSLLFSPVPDVSVLKAVSWTVLVATLLGAWSGLDAFARARLERQLFGGLVVLLLASLPLAFTETGYLVNGTGLQGVLSQPQVFGITIALLGAYVAGRLVGLARPAWHDVALLGLCVLLVFLSEARTAGLALLLGVGAALVISPTIAGLPARRLMPGLASPRLHALAFVLLFGLLAMAPMLVDPVGDYLRKRSASLGLLDAADIARGPIVEVMVDNIAEAPLTGIGFGIASEPAAMVVERDAVLGLPTSAAIEKGVMPVAVVEEIGLPGFALVAAWLWPMLRRGARAGVAAFAVVVTLLLTNLGESTLFSPGGMGLLTLILLAWAAAVPQPSAQPAAVAPLASPLPVVAEAG